MAVLTMKELTKHYGKARGVENLSMSVEEGEILGFIGPNGAGKSTTIRCIMNLLNKSSGEIYFEGKPLYKNDRASYGQIGYLPSEIRLYSNLTGAEMLRYNASFYPAGTMEKAGKLAERLQFDTAKKLSALSLGNGKKLGLILSLMHSPRLVVMDEATSGLDPLVQDTVYGIIREEQAAGTSFLFSSHNLSEVKKLCDRIAILREGHLLRLSPTKELTEQRAVRVRLEAEEAPPVDLGFVREGDGYTALFTGEMNQLLASLQTLHLRRLTIEEPELEEIFLHYYQ